MQVFCLRPIKTDHASWPASCVGAEIEWVKLWASDEHDARYKLARATDVPELQLPTKPAKKYEKKIPWPSPWELDDVTSCDLDISEPKPGLDILLSDRRRLPLK